MFGTLFRVQLRVFLALAVVTVIALTIVGVSQALNHSDLKEEAEASQQEARFWMLVAGEESSVQPTVENLLARDLQPLLHDVIHGEEDNDKLISRFRAPANRYGGITDAIGVDPFDGSGLNCTECGGLSAESSRKLQLIAGGDLDQVIDETVIEEPGDLDLIPLSLPLAAIAWYTAAGAISMGVGELYLRNLRSEYRVRSLTDLDWQHSSVERNSVVLLGWPVAIPFIVHRHLTHRRFEEQVRESFPEQVALIEQTDKMLERVSGPQGEELRQVRDEVMHELEVQTRSGMAGDLELQHLTEQLRNANEFLRLRSGVLEEEL